MKKAKFREVVVNGEIEFKVKKNVNDYEFANGEVVVLRNDYGANCPGFVHKYEKDNERADVTHLYICDIKRLKKNKRKEKEVQ